MIEEDFSEPSFVYFLNFQKKGFNSFYSLRFENFSKTLPFEILSFSKTLLFCSFKELVFIPVNYIYFLKTTNKWDLEDVIRAFGD